jgi:lysophospholipase L1-like esterase
MFHKMMYTVYLVLLVGSFNNVLAVDTCATQPNPANGATNVDLNSMLSWTTGAGAISHNIYLGTTSPGTLRNNQPVTLFYAGVPLAPETTYYWRVDEVNGLSTVTGNVWSFTTAPASGQCKPANPCAGLGATMVQATTPVARSGESWWATRHTDIINQIALHNPVDLIFIGDSITHGFDTAVWNQYYSARNPLNLGFSGDMTQNVLWRLNHGELKDISPKLAVIMIGTNNTFPPPSQVHTAENIADGIKNIACTVRRHLPNTKILILAIFPRGQYPSAERIKNAAASVLASQIADGKTIFYLDINSNFTNTSGVLSASIFPDFIHPNAAGDIIWANAMEPTIQKLMGE